jgi:hypothetical protein
MIPGIIGSTRGRRAGESAGLVLMLAAWIAILPGCGDPRQAWGEDVDAAAAIPLSKLLSADVVASTEPVTVSGRIGEVCRSAGCWFVLQDTVDGRLHEVLVDLKPRAGFTVPTSIAGRSAVVRGWFVGEKPDLKLEAVGLELE